MTGDWVENVRMRQAEARGKAGRRPASTGLRCADEMSNRPKPKDCADPGKYLNLIPNFAGHLDYAGEFRPLLILRKKVTFLGAGEAALRTQT